MKHILLIGNIDGQSSSLLRYASKFCNDMDLRLHILQIEPNNDSIFLSSPHYYNKTGFIASQETITRKKDLETFVNNTTKDIIINTSWISTKLLKGNVEQCLTSFVNKENIDLIITRLKLFKKESLRSDTVFDKIFLNISDIPVLIVPENYSYEPLNKLAYFSTFKEGDFNNLNWLKVNFEGSQIDIVNFSPKESTIDEKKWIKYLITELGENNISFLSKRENISAFIESQSNTMSPDYNFFGLTTRKRNFWQRIIDPSTTLNLLAKINIPTLIFKFNNDKNH